jgi:hypothetical protein
VPFLLKIIGTGFQQPKLLPIYDSFASYGIFLDLGVQLKPKILLRDQG